MCNLTQIMGEFLRARRPQREEEAVLPNEIAQIGPSTNPLLASVHSMVTQRKTFWYLWSCDHKWRVFAIHFEMNLNLRCYKANVK